MADNNRGSGEAFRRRQEARKRREPQTIEAKAEDVTTSPLAEPGTEEHATTADATRPDLTDLAPSGTDRGVGSASPDPLPWDAPDAAMHPAAPTGAGLEPTPEHAAGEPTALHTARSAERPGQDEVQDPLVSGEPVPLADFVRAADETATRNAAAFADTTPDATSQPSRASIIETGPASDVLPASVVATEADDALETREFSGGAPGEAATAGSPGIVQPPEMPDADRSGMAATPDVSPRSPSPVAEPKRSWLPAALAGLAALILVALAGIYYGEQVGAGDLAQKLDALNQRVASLEARPEPPKPTVDLAALQSRSASLDSDVAALKSALTDLTGKLDQVTQTAAANAARITTLEQHASTAPSDAKTPEIAGAASAPPAVPTPATPPTIASPPNTSPSSDTAAEQAPAGPAPAGPAPAGSTATSSGALTPPAGNPDLEALTGRVEDLSKRLAALPTEPPPPVDLAPLQGRIADLSKGLEAEQAIVAGLPRIDQAALEGRLTGLDRKVEQTSKSVDAVAQSVADLPKIDLAPLQASIAAVDQRLVPVEAALSAPKAGDRVTEARAVGSGDVSRAAPLAVVAGAVSRALDDGRPFGPELDALHGLGLDDAALGPLPGLAGPGAPTAATLRDRWSDLQPKVLTAAGPKTGDSMLDRFAAGARNLVQVRQVGASPDDDPSAASANIGAALDRGDIAEALSDWEKLPEASRTASQSWADAARSRLDADKSVQALMTRAIAALAPAKN